MGFFATWLTSELAVWHLLWQLVAVAVFVAFGALDSWPGWVGLAVMALSWIGLLAALVAASHTDDAFENAFAETLGASWRDTIDPVMSSHPSGIKWTRMFSALRFKRRGAVVRNRAMSSTSTTGYADTVSMSGAATASAPPRRCSSRSTAVAG